MREISKLKVKGTSNPGELRGGFVVVKGKYFGGFLPDLWRDVQVQAQGISCEELENPTTVSMCFIIPPIFVPKDICSGMSRQVELYPLFIKKKDIS